MSTDTLNIPVELTSGAIAEVKKLLVRPENADKHLRIGVKGGGCSGLSYVLEFDTPQEKDKFFEVDGITCIINPSHEMYLHGMQVEFEGGLNSRGFTFNNPNASKTCGCGTSFAV